MRKIISLILAALLMLSLLGINVSAASKPDALVNSLYKLQSGSFKVGYFGGSVTVGAHASNMEKTSWRAITRDWFKTNFPNANVVEVNASVGATGSNFGMYRTEEHLTKDKAPDLCFIEFAVNDLWDKAEIVSGKSFQTNYGNIETIIKKIYASNPKSDIVFVITGEIDSLRVDATSDVPVFGDKYTELANYYNIPIIYVGRELVRTIYKENNNVYPANEKDAVWKKYFDDIVHPLDIGYAHYANTIIKYLSSKLKTGYKATESDYTNHLNPEITYCEKNTLGDLYLDAYMIGSLSELKNCVNSGFTQSGEYMQSKKTGDSLEFDFQSPNIAVWHAGGAQIEIEYSIDGGTPQTHTFYQPNGTHKMYVLGTNLSDGNHRLKITRIGGNGNFNIQGIMLSGKAYVGKLAGYNKLPLANSPTFKLTGVNGGTKKMYLSCETKGATIYYTLDGTDPKASNTKTVYKGAITLKKDLQIKAYATKSGMRDSDVAVFDYKTYMEGYVVSNSKNNANEVVFTTNSETSKITSVKVDGKVIDKSNYVVSKQDKTISLKPEFIKTLGIGTHKIMLVFLDGDAECSFNIALNTSEETVSSETTETTGSETEKTEETESKKQDKNNSIKIIVIVSVAAAVLSVAGAVAFLLIYNAKSNKKEVALEEAAQEE